MDSSDTIEPPRWPGAHFTSAWRPLEEGAQRRPFFQIPRASKGDCEGGADRRVPPRGRRMDRGLGRMRRSPGLLLGLFFEEHGYIKVRLKCSLSLGLGLGLSSGAAGSVRVSEHSRRTPRILRVADVIWGTVWSVRPELTVLFLIHPNAPAPPVRSLPRVSRRAQRGHLPNSTSQTSHPVPPSPACGTWSTEADPGSAA